MNTALTQTKTTSLVWLAAWVIASALGVMVGFLGTLPLIWSVSDNVMKIMPQMLATALAGVFFGAGLGLATGFAQWLVLRRRGESNTRWLGASVIGGMVGGVVAILFSATFNDGGENEAMTAVAFALLGGILGAVQCLLARGVAKNVLWILASAAGLGLGAWIPFGAYNMEIVGVAAGGIIYGILTAAALWWFARQ